MRPPRATVGIAAIIICGACSHGGSSAAERFVESGDRYVQRGDDKGAAIEYRNAIRHSPALVEAHSRLAEVSTRLHDAGSATTALIKVAELKPHDSTAQLRAGEASLAIGNAAAARDAFTAALAIDPAQPAANRGLAVYYMMAGRPRDAEPYWKTLSASAKGDSFALADFYTTQRRLADAERELRTLVVVPQHTDAARLRLAGVLFDRGNRREADEIIATLIQTHGRTSAPWLARGRMRVAEKRMPEAAAAYARALKADPSSSEALASLTALDLAAKRSQDAKSRLERRLADDPNAVPVLMLAGQAYLATGDDDRAERTLQHIVEVAPDALEAYGLLGQLYVRQARLDAAREKFEAIATRASDPLPAKTMVAMILDAQHRPADAQREYEAILKNHASAGVAANNLAWLYLEQGRNDDALRYALTAKSELRRLPQASDTLGWVHYRMGRARDALPLLAECVDLQPRNPLYRYHLGMAYLKAGMREQAREQLNEALASPVRFDGRSEAEQTIASLASDTRQ